MNTADKKRSERIIKVYEDTQLNQREFAELIGVSQQLVSAVINYSKKANETILFAIIDNLENIDPLWLLTGKGEYKEQSVPQINLSTPIRYQINTIVEKQFEEFSSKILQRLSNIEMSVKEVNAKNILRRIDQDNARLISDIENLTDKLGS